MNVNEQKKKMVKITYRMKIHCIDIPTPGVETRNNTPLPLSRGESENLLFGGETSYFCASVHSCLLLTFLISLKFCLFSFYTKEEVILILVVICQVFLLLV